MNTHSVYNRSETALKTEIEESLSDKDLDHVVGGLNPQPLPPHDPPPMDKASPQLSWGDW